MGWSYLIHKRQQIKEAEEDVKRLERDMTC